MIRLKCKSTNVCAWYIDGGSVSIAKSNLPIFRKQWKNLLRTIVHIEVFDVENFLRIYMNILYVYHLHAWYPFQQLDVVSINHAVIFQEMRLSQN